MTITFEPLRKSHFPLLLKWLESPHVKHWWDPNVNWTPKLIEKKYTSYTQGFKRLVLSDQVIEKPMHAFIISLDGKAVGYIQYYNAYDFPREQGYRIKGLPKSLASLDIFIGERDEVSKGRGPLILEAFLRKHVFLHFDACFVDPDAVNFQAIRAYEKAGFEKIETIKNGAITWMVKRRE